MVVNKVRLYVIVVVWTQGWHKSCSTDFVKLFTKPVILTRKNANKVDLKNVLRSTFIVGQISRIYSKVVRFSFENPACRCPFKGHNFKIRILVAHQNILMGILT